MDFNQVRYFLALADTLNFTRAAELCYVSQPALTQGIKRLEEELGGELIQRDGRYTELTELGRGLRANFEQINQTRQLVNTTAKAIVSGEIAELNIGVMCTIGPRVIAGMLSQFQRNNPSISIILHNVTPPATEELLLSGGLDAVFCVRKDPVPRRVRYIDLFEESMDVVFPPGHEFLNYDAVPLAEVVKEKYVDRLHCEFRHQTHNLCNKQGLELNVVFCSEREDWIQCLISEGMGVSLIPRYSLLKPELSHRPIKDPVLSRNVELAVINDAMLPLAIEKLITEVTNYDWPSSGAAQ